MASHLPQPLLERLDRARQLLGDPASGLAGNREVTGFVEAIELTQLLHTLLLDDQFQPRRGVSLLEKKKVRGTGCSCAACCRCRQSCCRQFNAGSCGAPPPTRLSAGNGSLCAHPLPERPRELFTLQLPERPLHYGTCCAQHSVPAQRSCPG